jgi:hypothetical protein
MKILQNEITGIQTSFFTNCGGKLSFIVLKTLVEDQIRKTPGEVVVFFFFFWFFLGDFVL